MKNSLRLFAALTLLLSSSAFAQTTGNATATRPAHGRHFGPPPGSTLNSDGTLTLPDGTVVQPPTHHRDGTITLPDGTVIDPSEDHPGRPVKNIDGSLTLPDGTTVPSNADGTYTLPDGHVIDLSKGPPARGPGGPGGHRGPPPGGE